MMPVDSRPYWRLVLAVRPACEPFSPVLHALPVSSLLGSLVTLLSSTTELNLEERLSIYTPKEARKFQQIMMTKTDVSMISCQLATDVIYVLCLCLSV